MIRTNDDTIPWYKGPMIRTRDDKQGMTNKGWQETRDNVSWITTSNGWQSLKNDKQGMTTNKGWLRPMIQRFHDTNKGWQTKVGKKQGIASHGWQRLMDDKQGMTTNKGWLRPMMTTSYDMNVPWNGQGMTYNSLLTATRNQGERRSTFLRILTTHT
jgi:hypothetical protein